ncbi:uncharacterized protein PHALS_12344 [Plasmopara halstedii]|uniref:Uncharacterized protein n=1 Tax=Plasmopara halstedii TaxID=4781 RepID=A0A0P1AM93_PLAHL|nr:uncharacterized protein PHALS_12344 [Plasmopara halstedii]CEG42038.1 hypothetical protein PHALS_12344 [Plasmopara halstedii]|eukprot:XP_024578407.1 hypothetical protein PHALS_12344 [Plasmopara halstedii]
MSIDRLGIITTCENAHVSVLLGSVNPTTVPVPLTPTDATYSGTNSVLAERRACDIDLHGGRCHGGLCQLDPVAKEAQ